MSKDYAFTIPDEKWDEFLQKEIEISKLPISPRPKKTYRVFYHYYRRNNEMTVHYRGKCYHAKNVECRVNTETKWNDKQQPHLVLQGWTTELIHEDNKIIIL